jgi:hypothetical protein
MLRSGWRALALALVLPLLVAATPYATNPTFGAAVDNGGITIDGAGAEWTAEQVIALDMANDDPRSLGDNWTMHEAPWDLTHLYAAWDDENLYLAWQYVDVTDVLDPSNAGSAGGGKVNKQDLIQWIALDLAPGGAPLDMWGKNFGEPYWTGEDVPDVQIYLASNLWQGYLSHAVDGVFAVDDGGVNYFSLADAGIEVVSGDTLAASELWGVMDADHVAEPDQLVDFMTKGHATSRDTFYELKVPLATLGIERAQLEASGLGVMLGQGEGSCLDTIPNDPATSDTPGVSESNSPMEWKDSDALTAAFARVAAAKGGPIDPCATVTCAPDELCVDGECIAQVADEPVAEQPAVVEEVTEASPESPESVTEQVTAEVVEPLPDGGSDATGPPPDGQDAASAGEDTGGQSGTRDSGDSGCSLASSGSPAGPTLVLFVLAALVLRRRYSHI